MRVWNLAPWLLLPLLLVAGGCGFVVMPITHDMVVEELKSQGVTEADQENLKAGRLAPVRERLRSLDKPGMPPLSKTQLGLLCDLELKAQALNDALECNSKFQKRADLSSVDESAGNHRQALLDLAIGDYVAVGKHIIEEKDDQAQFLRMLADMQNPALQATSLVPAEKLATRFAQSDKVMSYLGAKLFAETGKCGTAISILDDKFDRLHADYGLVQGGNRPTFRLDLANSFARRYLAEFSFAPAANVYVELLAAQCYYMEHRTADVWKSVDRLMSFPGLSAYADVEWQVVHLKGRLERDAGDTASAALHFQEAIGLLERNRQQRAVDILLPTVSATTMGPYEDLVSLLIDQDKTEVAIEWVERARSRLLVERLAGLSTIAVRDAEQSVAHDLLNQRIAKEQELRLATSEADVREAREQLKVINRNIRQVSLDLAWKVGDFDSHFADIRPKLSAGQIAVIFFSVDQVGRVGNTMQAEKLWHVFVLTPDGGRPLHIRLGTLADPELLKSLRKANAEYGRYLDRLRASDRQNAEKVYDFFLRPVFNRAPAPAQSVLLLPYGELFSIPIDALYVGGVPVIEAHNVRVVPSLIALDHLRQTVTVPVAGRTILGNPDRPEKPMISNAGDQLKAVERAFPGDEPFEGKLANIANARRGLVGKQFLHVVAHGRNEPGDPTKSHLLLSEQAGIDDGNFSVQTIHGTRATTSLVVLSACETAVRDQLGYDTISIAEAFLASGVRSVVASHWEVEPNATAKLMELFYANLKRHSVADALWLAKKELRKTYPNPYYWAAFSVMGDDLQLDGGGAR